LEEEDFPPLIRKSWKSLKEESINLARMAIKNWLPIFKAQKQRQILEVEAKTEIPLSIDR
jgi:hypothetical protein